MLFVAQSGNPPDDGGSLGSNLLFGQANQDTDHKLVLLEELTWVKILRHVPSSPLYSLFSLADAGNTPNAAVTTHPNRLVRRSAGVS